MPTVDIPVMRGDECGYITLDAESDDPDAIWSHAVLGSSGYVAVGTELMAIRTHLLMPRERYPEPPAWDGWTDHQVIVTDEFACRVAASPNGLSIWVTDEYDYEPGDEPDATIPWTDVIAAMRKIGVKV